MPAHKKEHTTPGTTHRLAESSASRMPSQEDFHQYLRSQIRQAARVVMEEVMREELAVVYYAGRSRVGLTLYDCRRPAAVPQRRRAVHCQYQLPDQYSNQVYAAGAAIL